MPARSSRYKVQEVVRLLEKAGYTVSRSGTDHLQALKDGQKKIMFGSVKGNVHKNAIADIQRALGVHISQVIRPERGKKPNRVELERRISLAQQLLHAGFERGFVGRQCALDHIVRTRKFISFEEIETLQPKVLADKTYRAMMAESGVKIKQAPGVIRVPAPEKEVLTKHDDMQALLELLTPIAEQLPMLTRTDRISVFGRYVTAMELTLVDMRKLRDALISVNEIVNRIITRLEEPVERRQSGS